MTDGYTYKEENCECGLTEEGVWSDEVFDRFGCTCDDFCTTSFVCVNSFKRKQASTSK